MKLETGVDTDHDGALSDDEVQAATVLCNGETTSVNVATPAAGGSCQSMPIDASVASFGMLMLVGLRRRRRA